MKKISSLFKWIWKQCKDVRTFIIFIIVSVIWYTPFWLLCLLGSIFHNSKLISLGLAWLSFWAIPITPTIPILISITLVVKKIKENIKWKKNKSN